eukprot:TRINITY_DN46692_c0_g1_i1.p1 TRINITY_DN46692_c0_g1~~TRINITY_DN46692_c0_g1_i1.p1  ORF type:complete len:199 (+),score=36.59 TRINITY_DN46692_c0_g1_i1:29-625(+)
MFREGCVVVCVLQRCRLLFVFFFKQKTAYEMQRGLVGSEMCIRDSPLIERNVVCRADNGIAVQSVGPGRGNKRQQGDHHSQEHRLVSHYSPLLSVKSPFRPASAVCGADSSGKNHRVATVMTAGSATRVSTPESSMIEESSVLVVRYGTSDETSSGRNPMEITSTLRLMARAGASNIRSRVSFHDRVTAWMERHRSTK